MSRKNQTSAVVDGLLGDARGRLLRELCGRPQTARELATRVATSSNAVRVHLDGLRSAGLVDYRVERRGVGKPRHVYAITAAAENALSSAYAPTLQELLELLKTRFNGGFDPFLRQVGASLGRKTSRRRAGIVSAVKALESFGATTTVRRKKKETVVSTGCCPLAAVTREIPEACKLMESLLESASGMTTHEACVRGDHPRCHFAFSSPSPEHRS